MGAALSRKTRLAVAFLFFVLPTASNSQSARDKHAVYYDGGVTFATDGSLLTGACFRMAGNMTARDFFVNLKRKETTNGATFSRGSEIVSEFPDKLILSYVIRDFPCDPRFEHEGPHVSLHAR